MELLSLDCAKTVDLFGELSILNGGIVSFVFGVEEKRGLLVIGCHT